MGRMRRIFVLAAVLGLLACGACTSDEDADDWETGYSSYDDTHRGRTDPTFGPRAVGTRR